MTETESKQHKKTRKFKAEVRELLNIVINSLYTDKEIFVRELISNAADALEKMRHFSLTKDDIKNKDLPLEIRIELDENAGTFTIIDNGIGMTAEEASTNLGTIAHSGSREFLKLVAEGKQSDTSLIGQFGVGFYSAFMVSQEVVVETKSYLKDETGVEWISSADEGYTISETDHARRGTKIILKLKDEDKNFANIDTIKNLIKRYSNFVPFPIYVKGEQVNTVQAIWARSKNDISEKEYNEFYHFIHFGTGDPFYYLHFTADAPLAIKALLFFPDENTEKFGFGRMEPGVSLYCRKILIQQKTKDLLPEYFRFIRGVVDSEDLPLNISRETMQDSALIAKLKRVLTKRLIKHLSEAAEEDPKKYREFFKKFGSFIKEGVYTDYDNKNDLAKLLRFESSQMEPGSVTSLDGYIERMSDDQKEMYFITGPNRESIEAGPYLEAFGKNQTEVLYLYDGVDDLALTSLRDYEGKKIVSADSAEIHLPKSPDEEKKDEPDSLPEKEAGNLARWMKEILGKKISDVRVSKRLVSSPAVLVNPDDMMTTTMQKLVAATQGEMNIASYILEINAAHPILKRLNTLRASESDKEFAGEAVLLLFDNALISAGLMIDPKLLVERSTKMLEKALGTGE